MKLGSKPLTFPLEDAPYYLLSHSCLKFENRTVFIILTFGFALLQTVLYVLTSVMSAVT